ncbi:MAG: hypothetical protein M4579_005719 [Chaenotheca gracillima]|nr:MAG: hypothetical protein M4579_005719 [Chaenotheca gracillima]
MKSYGEIDLNDTPIVVLGCGHFFTTETLDGHMGIAEVYTQDAHGEYNGLQDVSAILARSVPRCADCQCPVRQYSTQRFNRVINKAVIDEMSKRFLVNGKEELRSLERQIVEIEHELENSRNVIISSIRVLSQRDESSPKTVALWKKLDVGRQLEERHPKARKLEKAIQVFCRKVSDKNQPALKLHDATVHAARQRSVDQMMTDLKVTDSVPAIPRDRRVTMGGRKVKTEIEHIMLTDRLSIAQVLKSEPTCASINIPGDAPERVVPLFFQDCWTFVHECGSESLPKLGVEGCLYYARIARLYESYCRSMNAGSDQASDYVKAAKELLETATEWCLQPFENADGLSRAVEEARKLLDREWYEEVTAEELLAIKTAMISGPRGLATHSGHWYNCANGHPFAIGECGMPMELARCPECGAPVGGQSHRGVEGVTRATEMED